MTAEPYDVPATRPRGARMPRRERRAQLMESALEVFVAQGYHAAAMDDIADRAGVSKPVLYQHFPGKLDLYLALLDVSCDTIIDNTRKALESTQDNKLRVAATMDVFFAYVASETGAFRLVFESDLTNEPAVREHVDRVTTECAAMIADVIRDDTGLPDDACPGCSPSRSWEWPRSARGSGCRTPAPSSSPTPRPWSPGSPGAGSAATRSTTDPPAPHTSRTTKTKEGLVEVKIGVQNAARELTVELDESSENVEKLISDALAAEDGVFTLTDTKGRKVIVPAAKLAYVEIGHGSVGQVGFRG